MKVIDFDNNKTQTILLADEAMLRTIIGEIVSKALKEVKDTTPEPLSRKEVLSLLHIGETKLWALGQQGALHPIRLGGKVLYDRSEVLSLANGKRGAEC